MGTWVTLFNYFSALLGLGYVGSVVLSYYRSRQGEGQGEGAGKANRANRAPLWALLATAAAFAAIIVALGFEKRGIFSPGQRLAWGVILGAAAGLLCAGLCWLAGEGAAWAGARDAELRAKLNLALGVAAAAPAVLAVSVALSLFSDFPQDALSGVALGAVLVCVVVLMGWAIMERSGTTGARREELLSGWCLPLEFFGTMAVACAAATYLAVEHFPKGGEAPALALWGAPAALGGLGIVAAVLVQPYATLGAVAGERWRAVLGGSVVGAGVVAVVCLVFGLKAVQLPALAKVGVWGAIAGALVMFVARYAPAAGRSDIGRLRGALVGVALVLLTVAVCFKLLAGFGVGLAVVAALATMIVASGFAADGEGKGEQLRAAALAALWCLGVGAGYLVYRVLLERSPQAQAMDLSTHYVFLCMLAVPVVVGLGLSANEVAGLVLEHRRGSGPGQEVWAWVALRVGALGAVTAGLCLALLVLWGYKAALGVVCGAPLALILLLVIWAGWGERRAEGQGREELLGFSALALGAALFAAQVATPWSALMGATIRQRLWVVVGLVLVALVWLAADIALVWRAGRRGGEGER